MSEAKICNLDVIAPIQKRELILGGVSYEVLPLSVERFIEITMKRREMMEAKSLEKGFEVAKEAIRLAIPNFSDEVFALISMEQMGLIMDFILDTLPEDKLQNNGEQQKEPEKAEPEKAKPEKDEAEAGK